MAQKVIRNIPDDILAAIEQKAQAAGQSSEEWIRSLLTQAASGPLVRERYAYRFYGPEQARGTVRRLSDHVNGVGSGYNNLSAEQADAVSKAQDFMRRNEPGDQMKAYDLLKTQFEEVFEVPI